MKSKPMKIEGAKTMLQPNGDYNRNSTMVDFVFRRRMYLRDQQAILEEARLEGFAIGLEIGKRQRAIQTLLELISSEFGSVPPDLEMKIQGQTNRELLDQLSLAIAAKQILTLEELAERLP